MRTILIESRRSMKTGCYMRRFAAQWPDEGNVPSLMALIRRTGRLRRIRGLFEHMPESAQYVGR